MPGPMLNASRLAAGLGVSGQTVARYLDTLVDPLLLVRRIAALDREYSSGWCASPQVYVRDTGVAHALA